MLFYLRFVVITLYLRMISYWYVFLFWHCLGCYNVRKKTELLTKGWPKLQYHAGCIAHFSFLHEMPNKTNRLQPCACNAPLAYIYILTQCLYVCLSVWLPQMFCSNIQPSLSRELTNESSYIRGRFWLFSHRHIIAMVICYAISFVLVMWRNVTQI